LLFIIVRGWDEEFIFEINIISDNNIKISEDITEM
jgi:hypothetical protein